MKQTASKKQSVAIIGAGLSGAFLAILLARRGYNVNVFERYSEKETLDYSTKRSFNITFYGYGVKALEEAGLWDEVRPIMLRLEGGATQILPEGDFVYSRFEKGEMEYFAVARAKLLEVLINAAKREPLVKFHFGKSIVSANRTSRTLTVADSKTNKPKTIKTCVVIGADGVNSMTRSIMQQCQQTRHTVEYAPWTYRQIALTPAQAKVLNLKPDIAYSWTRRRACIIGFPQLDGQFGALLMLPDNQTEGYASLKTPEDVKRLISTQFPSLLPALDPVTKSILNNPDGSFVTVNTKPWACRDFIAIVGDAAHGFPPFFGMGTATAFGDCMEIAHLLDTYGPEWGTVFKAYEENRKANTDVISMLSNEMLKRFTRHTRADRTVIYDRVDTILSNKIPGYLPSMFDIVAHQPNRSAEFYKKHRAQRKRNRYLGLSLGVTALTVAVALTERFQRRYATFSQRRVN